MAVSKIYQKFKCGVCGNEVEVAHVGGGILSCCNQPMKLLTDRLTDVYLAKAFAGESQARNKYDYFASAAKKEGYEQIAGIFAETALNEKEHAKREFKFLNGINSTVKNLDEAAKGEIYEFTIMYPDFAKTATEEGRPDIAAAFFKIAEAEKGHAARYQKLKANIEREKVFKSDKPVSWRCRNCGYLHTGTNAPDKCPACDHDKAYFELEAINY
jgi:desulfoferrodoxin-like iron-binding protein